MGGENAILLIPDISGFTSFVKETERNHSQHIISELLSIIIEHGNPDFEVAEIEGDAVFFYKLQEEPDLNLIINKAKNIFTAFHQHLLLYQHKRVCNCGACSSAIDLSLKVVAHHGEIDFINVGDIKKPFGKHVILIHKLLKNKIDSKEYLLFTKAFPDIEKKNLQFEVNEGETFYDNYGLVGYNYISLTPLLSNLNKPVQPKIYKSSKPVTNQITIPCAQDRVLELLSNLNHRSKWQKGVDKLVYDDKDMNRVGSSHICVVNGKDIKFDSVVSELNSERGLVFGEKTTDIPLVKEIYTYYIIEKISDSETLLTIEVHAMAYPLIGKLFLPMFNKLMGKNIKSLMTGLKAYCLKMESFSPELSIGDINT